MLNNSVILVTGSFGKKFLEMVFEKYNPAKVIIYSRDEFKQSVMKTDFSGKVDMSKVRFFIGDVRDRDRLYRAFHGVDYVVHAAAMKQVPTCESMSFRIGIKYFRSSAATSMESFSVVRRRKILHI